MEKLQSDKWKKTKISETFASKKYFVMLKHDKSAKFFRI